MAKKRTTSVRRPAPIKPQLMADAPPPPPPDDFVQLSSTTWTSLSDAVLELGWIADGGDSSATPPDQDMANLKRVEYEREKIRVMQRLMAYLAKKLSIQPPSKEDLDQAKLIATHLAAMRDVNVKASAVVDAASTILEIYNKS